MPWILALVNSWMEYKNEATLLGVKEIKIMDLWDFRERIAQHLILHRKTPK